MNFARGHTVFFNSYEFMRTGKLFLMLAQILQYQIFYTTLNFMLGKIYFPLTFLFSFAIYDLEK